MEKYKKHLYCPKCNNYPDTVYETEEVITKRKWDGECYEGEATQHINSLQCNCGECETILIEKEDK